jgi:hypothetical protein
MRIRGHIWILRQLGRPGLEGLAEGSRLSKGYLQIKNGSRRPSPRQDV